MMRKSEFAVWAFLILAVLAAGTTVYNLSRSHSACAAKSDIYRHLDLFGDVLERVRSDYVEKPDDSKLIETAINGLLSALDPHSAFLNAKHFRDMQVQTRGEFGDLGIEVTMENGVVKVVSPIEDTPAALCPGADRPIRFEWPFSPSACATCRRLLSTSPLVARLGWNSELLQEPVAGTWRLMGDCKS